MHDRYLQREREREREEREREKKKQGRGSSSCHFSDQYFPVFYVNIRPSFSKTRTDYFNIKTRETINVSTNAVVHYFSQ